MGVEFTSLLLLLQRIYVCNYGNMTVNYTDSMKQQDGMNYWYSIALWWLSCPLHSCRHTLSRVLHLIFVKQMKLREEKCVCMCVCVSERERKREEKMEVDKRNK